MVIDAHQHFWQIDRGDYSWMDDSVAAIRKDYLPRDMVHHAHACGVTGTVVVQAAPTVDETLFLLQLADRHEIIKAVVGWIDLRGLLTSSERNQSNFLNGIAYDEANDRLFVTGKLWPWMFEIDLTAPE